MLSKVPAYTLSELGAYPQLHSSIELHRHFGIGLHGLNEIDFMDVSISQEAYSIVHGPDKKNGKLEMLPDRFIS